VAGEDLASEDRPTYGTPEPPRSAEEHAAMGELYRLVSARTQSPSERATSGRVGAPSQRMAAAIERLTATSRSALADAAVAAVEALEHLRRAAAQADEESLAVVGDAVLAVQQARSSADGAMLQVLGSFDARDGAAADGAASSMTWLQNRTNLDHAQASALVATARHIPGLPLFHAHLQAGDISLRHAETLSRQMTTVRERVIRASDALFTKLAMCRGARDVRHAARSIDPALEPDPADPDGQAASDPDEPADHPEGHPDRELRLNQLFDGLGDLRGTLEPLVAEVFAQLLIAFDEQDPPGTPLERRRTPAQRRHDAFARMLQVLTALPETPTVHGFPVRAAMTFDLLDLLAVEPGHPLAGLTLLELAQRLGIELPGLDGHPDALRTLLELSQRHAVAVSAEEEVHAEAAPAARASSGDADPSSAGEGSGATSVIGFRRRPPRLASGRRISRAHARRLLSQRGTVLLAMLTLGPWRAVNVGSAHRTLPAWLRLFLHALHPTCRGPDCDRPASWTQAAHLDPWDGNWVTDVNRSLPLCLFHHDLHDNKGWTVTFDDVSGDVTWCAPDGRRIVVPAPDV
jgi:hypothetical protein